MLLEMKFNESDAVKNSLGGFADVGEGEGEGCGFEGFEGCFGDSKIEHNFLTLPFNEFPAETIEPKGEL